MNWKILSLIWNAISIIGWIIALFFSETIVTYFFKLIENHYINNFYDLFQTITNVFFVLMILLNLLTSYFSIKAENQKAMLWLIGLTYAQFLLFVGFAILTLLIFVASYFL